MSIFEPARSPWPSRMLSVLRIVTAIVFIQHGTQKILGFPAGSGPRTPYVLVSLTGLAGLLETFGGLSMLIGLFTRPIAFLLCGEMAVAYFKVHFPRSFYPAVNGGDNAVLFCFIFLYLVFAGAGEWSVDALLAGKHPSRSGVAR